MKFADNLRNIPHNDIALLMIRLMVGYVMFFHGAQKLLGWFGGYGLSATAGFFENLGIPFPYLSAVLAANTEFFGGLLVMAGVFTRLMSIPLAFTMVVASVTAHWGTFSIQAGGMEYSLTLAVIFAALVFSGGGRFTVAALVRRVANRDRERVPQFVEAL